MHIVSIPISELNGADYNPRTISEKDMEALKKSLEHFGYVEPVVWNKRTNRIIVGHQRVDALRSLGYTGDIYVVELDIPEINEKKLNIGLSKIGGEFDNLLTRLVDENDGFDVVAKGYSYIDVGNLLTRLVDEDEVNN